MGYNLNFLNAKIIIVFYVVGSNPCFFVLKQNELL
jgi:hypothetical protein